MRVLFVASQQEDYLSDTLMHGLRAVLGSDLVDWPRPARMYRPLDDTARRALYGRGFTVYGLLDDLPIDRSEPLGRAIGGDFDLVVLGNLWRDHRILVRLAAPLRAAGTPVVLLDGQDTPAPYPHHPHFLRTPRTLLRRDDAGWPYYKRELTPLTRRLTRRELQPISFSIPEEHVLVEPPSKDKLLASHIVDRQVAERRSAQWGDFGVYSFTDQADYYLDLQRSRFGITTKRAGWDALRHYETAANGCVPAFRRLDDKPDSCAPHGLNRTNCVVYRDAEDLFGQIEQMPDERYAELQAASLSWARENTTRRRAEQFLSGVTQ